MTVHRFPEDAGTGAHPSGSGDKNDAANFAQAYDAIGKTDYAKGLSFDVDYTVPEVTIDMEKAVVTDDSATATQATETRSGVAFIQEMDAVTRNLTDAATNYIYLDLDLSTDDGASYHIDTDQTPPSAPYLYLGSVDTSADSYSLANELPSEEFASVNAGQTNSTIYAAPEHRTIQGAIDAVETKDNDELALQRVLVSPAGTGGYQETFTLPSDVGTLPVMGEGHQAQTHVEGSGDHAVTMAGNDAYLTRMWVDQVDSSGSYDAIHASEREPRIENVGNDFAPRYALNLTGPAQRAFVHKCEFEGGDVACVRLAADMCEMESVQLTGPFPIGLLVQNNPKFCKYDGSIRLDDDTAVGIRVESAKGNEFRARIDGGAKAVEDVATTTGNRWNIIARGQTSVGVELDYHNTGDFIIQKVSGDGMHIVGNYNNVNLKEYGCTGDALVVDGSHNTIQCNIDGTVVLNGDNNKIEGYVGGGTPTDNGTGNDTSDVMT